MNKLDKDYTDLLQDILDNGVEKKDRTGTGTISVFGRQIRHDMKDGFPLLTTKKMPFKTIVTELLWFLRGETNIKFLVDNNCHIWDGDAYKNFKSKTYPQSSGLNEFDKEDFIIAIKNGDYSGYNLGELGPIYGAQWRGRLKGYGFNEITGAPLGYGIDPKLDQIQNLINDLKTNPDSRRLMVNAWAVQDLPNMVLPPCHYGFQVYTRELSWYERAEIDGFMEGTKEALRESYIYNSNFKGHRFYGIFNDTDTIEEIFDKLNIPTRAISLMWNQRSVDTFLGLPFNIASYGLLLEIIAKEVNMVPDELIGNLGDVHLYSNHIEQAKEQIGQPIFEESPTLYPNGPMNEGIKKRIMVGRTREPFTLPKLMICDDMRRTDGFKAPFDELDHSLLKLIDYQSHPTIKAPLSN